MDEILDEKKYIYICIIQFHYRFFFLISILYSIRSIDVLFTRFFYLLFLIFNLHILFYINFYI